MCDGVSHRTIMHRGVGYPCCRAGHLQTAHTHEGAYWEQKTRARRASRLLGHGCVRGNHLSQELLVLSAASKAR